ncbi:MAG TPA: hypothetical protein VGD67_21585, partial [Pseudonocardiaceae bacterium]
PAAAGAVAGRAEDAVAAVRPADVGANYFMKWGAVCSPPGDFNRKVDILRRMRPATVRVSMFWNSPNARQFSNAQLDALLSTGLTEMIFQSSEYADANLAYNQLNMLLPYIDAHPNILFIWELGNEPDYYDSPTNPAWCRYKRLTTIRDNKPRQNRSNMFWAINMPAGRWDIPNGSTWYFNEFVRDHGDGLGPMLTGHLRPSIATVHCYAHDRLCATGGESNPFKMVDWVRGWNPNMPMKVTEAGINSRPADRGHRYIEFGAKLAERTGNRADSVCFYGLPDVEDSYALSYTDADQIASRARSWYC